MQLVMVCRADEQVGIIVLAFESGSRAESSAPSPQPSLVRMQRQRFVAQGIASLVSGPFIKVVKHNRMLVRLKRPSPRVVSV